MYINYVLHNYHKLDLISFKCMEFYASSCMSALPASLFLTSSNLCIKIPFISASHRPLLTRYIPAGSEFGISGPLHHNNSVKWCSADIA